jgi:hypothetical protein
MFEMKMSAAARGYKQAGKKLICRDAADYQYGKTNRERKRRIAAELAHNERVEREYLESIGSTPDKSELRVARCRLVLSARRAKPVEELFMERVNGDAEWATKVAKALMGRAQWRYWEALDNDYCWRLAQEADDQLLAHARG